MVLLKMMTLRWSVPLIVLISLIRLFCALVAWTERLNCLPQMKKQEPASCKSTLARWTTIRRTLTLRNLQDRLRNSTVLNARLYALRLVWLLFPEAEQLFVTKTLLMVSVLCKARRKLVLIITLERSMTSGIHGAVECSALSFTVF